MGGKVNDTHKGYSKQKGNLPTKVCATCGRSFSWRKHWARNWEEIRYCSDRCRNHRSATARQIEPPREHK